MLLNHERKSLLEEYARSHQELVTALSKIPADAMHWKPGPEKWSIHEIVVHIADAETHGYIRCRTLISEPGKTVMTYDQDHWAVDLGYQEQDIADALELFRLVRSTTYRLLLSIPDSAWNHTIHHPERGMMMLDDWLPTYASHIPNHIAQIERNVREWEAAGQPAEV
jgi:hypothetical protein